MEEFLRAGFTLTESSLLLLELRLFLTLSALSLGIGGVVEDFLLEETFLALTVLSSSLIDFLLPLAFDLTVSSGVSGAVEDFLLDETVLTITVSSSLLVEIFLSLALLLTLSSGATEDEGVDDSLLKADVEVLNMFHIRNS